MKKKHNDSQELDPGAVLVRGRIWRRKCHDCGRATSDYRCADCWGKYRSAVDLAELSPFEFVCGD